MADNPYAPGFMNPNASRAGLFDLRMMSAANRMETPFEHVRSGRGRSIAESGMFGNNMTNEPDYSQFTFDPQAHAAATQALAPYGLSPLEASQVQQNQILPNSGFFGAHPRLSAAIEGGLFGGAAAHGGDTAGESIQGALAGMIGGRQLKQNLYNQQFAKPFEAAGMLERLEDMRQKRDLQAAEIEHYRIMNQKLGRPDHDVHAMPINKNDQSLYQYDNTTGEGKFIPNPDFDPALVRSQHTASNLDIGTREQLMIMGVQDPGQASPPQIALANKRAQAQAVERGSAIAGGSANARIPSQNYSDARREHDKRIDGLSQQMLKNNDPAHQQWVDNQILDKHMADAIKNPDDKTRPKDFLFSVDPKERQAYMDQYNQRIQSQIEEETQRFGQAWPQSIEAPPSPKRSSQKTGSGAKAKTYDPTTGQLR